MHITVFGASGRTGSLVVDEALAAGHHVTAFVRDPAKLQRAHERLSVVQGDSSDPSAIASAAAGADAAISALGPVKGSPKDLLVTAQRNIVAALEQAGVRRYVVLTGAGVRDANDQPKIVDHIFGFLLRLMAADVLRDSEASIGIVRASSLDWVVVRGPRLTDGAKTGSYRVGYVGAESGTQISRADLAVFMVEQVAAQTPWLRRMPVVTS
jgi:putative NADH-flavin reductase